MSWPTLYPVPLRYCKDGPHMHLELSDLSKRILADRAATNFDPNEIECIVVRTKDGKETVFAY